MLVYKDPQSTKAKNMWSVFKDQLFPYARNEQENKISATAHTHKPQKHSKSKSGKSYAIPKWLKRQGLIK